jgi:hypothetical protein
MHIAEADADPLLLWGEWIFQKPKRSRLWLLLAGTGGGLS